jgi:hypothetical protein
MTSALESRNICRIELEPSDGYVYLAKSGRHYKIGRSNSIGRREYELAIQLLAPDGRSYSVLMGCAKICGVPTPRAARGSHPTVTLVARQRATIAPATFSRTREREKERGGRNRFAEVPRLGSLARDDRTRSRRVNLLLTSDHTQTSKTIRAFHAAPARSTLS